MGLLDLFSGESGRNTAIWGANNTNLGAQQQRDYINRGTDLSLSALGSGNAMARQQLEPSTTWADQRLGEAWGSALNTLAANDPNYRALAGQGDQYLANAGQQGDQYLANAGQQADLYYQPLGAQANAGFSAYGDAAGVNGDQGQTRARQNFQTGPGYTFARDEALNAATRGANAAGMTASGNTMDSLSRLGNNLANQEWGSYVNRLSPYLNLAPQIAGQRAGYATGIAGQRANLGQQTANQRATLGQQLAGQLGQNQRDIAGLHTGLGNARAGLSTGYGNTLASLATGLGTSQAGLYSDQARNLSNITGAETGTLTGLGTAGLQAGQQANANTWNAGMQVANLAADMFGKVKNPFG
jgi:hypothetical protein